MLRAFSERNGIGFPLLADQGSAVIRRLGLLNMHLAAQSAAYGIQPRPEHEGVPYPGSFLLDERGVIVEKRFEQSYRERETGAGVLERGFGGHSSRPGVAATGGSDGVAVRASLDSASYVFFQRLWLTVTLTINPGLHVYGRPIPEGFVPVDVEVEPLEGVTVGEPAYPPPQPFRMAGLDEQLYVYEGTLTLALPITFAVRDAGDLIVRVTVRYQACSDADCLLPATVALDLPVRAAALTA